MENINLQAHDYTTKDDELFNIELSKKLQQLYALNSFYKYIDSSGCLSMLKNSTLRFSSSEILNDPFDCYDRLIDFSNVSDTWIEYAINSNGSTNKMSYSKKRKIKFHLKANIQNIMKEFIPSWKKDHKLTCFTEDQYNLLMWAHYAKSHSGCCIGLNSTLLIPFIINKFGIAQFSPVEYTKDFTPINYFESPKRALQYWLATKSIDWSYEKEIRIAIETGDSNLNFDLEIDKNIFQSLYLGYAINLNVKNEIIELCKNKYPHIKVFEMKLASNKFALNANLVKLI